MTDGINQARTEERRAENEIENAIERAKTEGPLPLTGQGMRAMADRKLLAEDVERLQAALAMPEIYAGVISEAIESHLDEVMLRNKELQAIVDALPKCWRLVDGVPVQDVPVVPGMAIWVEYGGKIEPDRAWQFYQHRFSGEPIQWFVLLGRGGFPIGDCYDSPEAAEHAAKAKGKTDG